MACPVLAVFPIRVSVALQEVTRTGAHVRSIGVGDLFRDVHGIAAVGGLLVVTALEGYTTLFVFDLHTGHRLRSFGEEGSCEGELTQSVGVRFTPDGSHILIADGGNNRLSLFTMTGDFVRCIGVDALDSPEDVDFSSNGDILVADCNKNRVCVFSPDGSTLLRAFGMTGDEGEQLKEPIALAMHDQYLYVLDWGSARVQLFA